MELGFWEFVALLTVAALVVRLAPGVPEPYRIAGSLAVVLVLLVLAPYMLNEFRVFQLSRVLYLVVVAVGLNMLTGYNGQISLGHGAFVALGAYTAGLLMDRDSQMGFLDADPWPFWAAIIVAGVLAALLGFALGFPALRLSGPYLAIATLALIISFPQIIVKYDEFTGGSQGIRIRRPEPPGFLGDMDTDRWIYFLALFLAVVMLIVAWSILRGPLGRAFVAVRDSEVAAAAMGVNVARTKVTAFTISAFYAGVAGAAHILVTGNTGPNDIDIVDSINYLTAIVIGGLASILGSAIGAFFLVFLPDEGPSLVEKIPVDFGVVDSAPGVIQGALVILVALLMPYGFAGFFRRIATATPTGIAEGARALPGRAAALFDRFRGRPGLPRGETGPSSGAVATGDDGNPEEGG